MPGTRGLVKADKADLRRASRSSIEAKLRALMPSLRRRRWVPSSNSYASNTIDRIRRHLPGRVNGLHLAQYIAASAPLHLLDGWTYLGRAADAVGRGDATTARHLAYYAELRAALALLATEGIGVFSNRHFVVGATATAAKLRYDRGTHQATWLMLEHWATLQKSMDVVGQVIAPYAIPLAEWTRQFRTPGSLHALSIRWLKTWGLDLHRLAEDRVSRNEASYNPTTMVASPEAEPRRCFDFLCNLWALCEPSTEDRFPKLDLFLLRRTLEAAFHAVTGSTHRARPSVFRGDIDRMLAGLGLNGTPGIGDFLLRRSTPNDPAVLLEAEKQERPPAPYHHLQVCARALLLLRLATGSCARVLVRSGIQGTDVAFWWTSLGPRRGLWNDSDRPNSLSDQWSDVSPHLQTLADWLADNAEPTFTDLRRSHADAAMALGELERVCLWGLGL